MRVQQLDQIEVDLFHLQHLRDNIRQHLDLLNEYEGALIYEDDPLRRARYLRQIERLRSSLEEYQQEYHELQTTLTSRESGQLADIGAQLREIDTKIDAILAEQIGDQANTGKLRAAMLVPLGPAERVITATMLERLNQKQLFTIQGILNALRKRQFSQKELKATLSALEDALDELRRQRSFLSYLTADDIDYLSELLARPSSDMNISDKLAITIPIIPFILSYQREISLQRGLKLKQVWDRLVTKVRGSHESGPPS